MPGLFVVLWSTGFIGAKYGLPYAEPFTFLTLRFFLVAAIMLAALIVGLQPLITASLVGILLGESVSARQWLGLALGLLGLVLVLWGRLTFDLPHLAALAAVVAAPFGMTFGTLYQKRFCAAIDLRSATVIQNATAALVMLLLALAAETMHIDCQIHLVAAPVSP